MRIFSLRLNLWVEVTGTSRRERGKGEMPECRHRLGRMSWADESPLVSGLSFMPFLSGRGCQATLNQVAVCSRSSESRARSFAESWI
jgi:hypothetical protein